MFCYIFPSSIELYYFVSIMFFDALKLFVFFLFIWYNFLPAKKVLMFSNCSALCLVGEDFNDRNQVDIIYKDFRKALKLLRFSNLSFRPPARRRRGGARRRRFTSAHPTSGVPQGSNFEYILFKIFADDLIWSVSTLNI